MGDEIHAYTDSNLAYVRACMHALPYSKVHGWGGLRERMETMAVKLRVERKGEESFEPCIYSNPNLLNCRV